MLDYIHTKSHALLCRIYTVVKESPGFDLQIVPSRLKDGLQSLQSQRPAMTPHLPFSDIGPAFTDSFTVFTLENSQRSSSSLVYNCVCSFKCEAENVSLGASSVVPWHTVGAVHLRKGHLSILSGLMDVESGSDSCRDISDLLKESS